MELPEFLPSFFLFFPVSNFLVSHHNELKWSSKEFLNHKSLKFGTVHTGYKPQDGVAVLIGGILLLSSALPQADWGQGDRKWPPAERIRLEKRKTLDETSWACFFPGVVEPWRPLRGFLFPAPKTGSPWGPKERAPSLKVLALGALPPDPKHEVLFPLTHLSYRTKGSPHHLPVTQQELVSLPNSPSGRAPMAMTSRSNGNCAPSGHLTKGEFR